jgi:predicted 3-demethylubiquinone-9 3-methyltransferase (glyoxalase superfamily)
MKVTQKITTFLWFDDQAEKAVRHYLSIFNNSRIVDVTHYSAAGPRPDGSVLTITFELEGQQFIALNSGPQYKFTEAISLMVSCETQDEVDSYWAKLGAGGEWGRAAGSRTNTACRGRSRRPSYSKCCSTLIASASPA